MKRKALIIGSSLPSNNEDHLKGVAEDILNYRKLLTSANGGAWHKEEIIELYDPSSHELKRAKMYQDGADYALTIFSGHGFMDGDVDYLCINERQNIDFQNLFPDSVRSAVIMDACRVGYNFERTPGIYGLDLQFEEDDKIVAREIYESVIAKVPSGRLALFSASANESAFDTEDGGAFTVALFTRAIEWINSNSTGFLVMNDAFQQANTELKKYTYTQSPEILYTDRRMGILPLATNPRFYLNKGRSIVNNTLSSNQRKPKGVSIYIVG